MPVCSKIMLIAWLTVCGAFFFEQRLQFCRMGFQLAFWPAVAVVEQALQSAVDVTFDMVGHGVRVNPGDVRNRLARVTFCAEVNSQAFFSGG